MVKCLEASGIAKPSRPPKEHKRSRGAGGRKEMYVKSILALVGKRKCM